MYLLLVAVALSLWKWQNIEPVASWSWWIIIGVSAATAVWWQVADSTGYTKRKAMEREDNIKKERNDRHRDALRGVNSKRKK